MSRATLVYRGGCWQRRSAAPSIADSRSASPVQRPDKRPDTRDNEPQQGVSKQRSEHRRDQTRGDGRIWRIRMVVHCTFNHGIDHKGSIGGRNRIIIPEPQVKGGQLQGGRSVSPGMTAPAPASARRDSTAKCATRRAALNENKKNFRLARGRLAFDERSQRNGPGIARPKQKQ